eukprot:s5832_g2.t1
MVGTPLPGLHQQKLMKDTWSSGRQAKLLQHLLADVSAALIVGFGLAIILAPIDLAMLRPALRYLKIHESRQTRVARRLGRARLRVPRLHSVPRACAPSHVMVWLCTTTVNCIVMCLKDARQDFLTMPAKDAYLTGGSLVPPSAAIVAWVARDLMFSLVVFVLPDKITGNLRKKGITTIRGFQDVVQILLPLPLQLFTTPLHFLGISFVAHPGALGASVRLAAAFREFGLRVGIRCARVLVPYCFGAVVNRKSVRRKHRRLGCLLSEYSTGIRCIYALTATSGGSEFSPRSGRASLGRALLLLSVLYLMQGAHLFRWALLLPAVMLTRFSAVHKSLTVPVGRRRVRGVSDTWCLLVPDEWQQQLLLIKALVSASTTGPAMQLRGACLEVAALLAEKVP